VRLKNDSTLLQGAVATTQQTRGYLLYSPAANTSSAATQPAAVTASVTLWPDQQLSTITLQRSTTPGALVANVLSYFSTVVAGVGLIMVAFSWVANKATTCLCAAPGSPSTPANGIPPVVPDTQGPASPGGTGGVVAVNPMAGMPKPDEAKAQSVTSLIIRGPSDGAAPTGPSALGPSESWASTTSQTVSRPSFTPSVQTPSLVASAGVRRSRVLSTRSSVSVNIGAQASVGTNLAHAHPSVVELVGRSVPPHAPVAPVAPPAPPAATGLSLTTGEPRQLPSGPPTAEARRRGSSASRVHSPLAAAASPAYAARPPAIGSPPPTSGTAPRMSVHHKGVT